MRVGSLLRLRDNAKLDPPHADYLRKTLIGCDYTSRVPVCSWFGVIGCRKFDLSILTYRISSVRHRFESYPLRIFLLCYTLRSTDTDIRRGLPRSSIDLRIELQLVLKIQESDLEGRKIRDTRRYHGITAPRALADIDGSLQQ